MAEEIDLRSDLLARPTQAMIACFAKALSEAAHFELREDLGERRLEARIAELTGQEDALLFPTCTMANQAALAVLSRHGDGVLTQQDAHILTSEGGAASAISGLQISTIAGDKAAPEPGLWAAMARESRMGARSPITTFVIENTHNRAGGKVLPIAYVASVLAHARGAGIRVHLDGARLFNAAIALGCPAKELAVGFDSVAISLNKGLGAPFGAALAASRPVIEAALLWRQRLGGGIRRFGPIAAAAELALEDFSHLRDDHRRAKSLARKLAALPRCGLDWQGVETNIVILELPDRGPDAPRLAMALQQHGIRVLPLDARRLRMTTYRGITDLDVEHTAGTFERLWDLRS